MRILLGHTYYRQPGGEDRVFEDEAALLERRGHEVVRYTRHNDELEGLGAAGLARTTHWNPQTFAEVSSLIQKTKPDVAHFHNTFPLMSASVYDACGRARVPVAQTLHNYRLLCPAATLFRDGHICEDCLHLSVKLPAVRHSCYRDDWKASAAVTSMLAYHHFRDTRSKVGQFVAVSDFVRDKYVAAGMSPDHVTAKPNAVADVTPGPGGGYALFVGRLVPEKGVGTLLEAWASLGQQLPLKIVGDGPLAGAAEEAAERYQTISYLGQKSKGEVTELMQHAALLVFPSEWFEPFGLVIAEAFAAGTPVVAADSESVKALVEEGVTGRFFEAGSSHSLVTVVREVLGEPEKLQKMRGAARAAFEARFSQDASYTRLIEIYKRMLSSNA